jgi:ribosomal protein L7/L12
MDDSTIQHHIQAINERLRRLEDQTAALSQKVGIPFQAQSDAVPAEVVELARSDKRLEAIRLYRQLTNASFEEARGVVYGL